MSGAKLDAKICAIGETKVHPDGKTYRKVAPMNHGLCHGCAFFSGGNCPSFSPAIGADCKGSIWKLVEPAKPITKPKKWEPVDLRKGVRLTGSAAMVRGALETIINRAEDQINALGRKLTALQNKAKENKA